MRFMLITGLTSENDLNSAANLLTACELWSGGSWSHHSAAESLQRWMKWSELNERSFIKQQDDDPKLNICRRLKSKAWRSRSKETNEHFGDVTTRIFPTLRYRGLKWANLPPQCSHRNIKPSLPFRSGPSFSPSYFLPFKQAEWEESLSLKYHIILD